MQYFCFQVKMASGSLCWYYHPPPLPPKKIGPNEQNAQIVITSSVLKAMSLVWWTPDVNPSTTINCKCPYILSASSVICILHIGHRHKKKKSLSQTQLCVDYAYFYSKR